MNAILQFENVSLRYHTKTGETAAVEGLDFQVLPGEFVAFIGPSGCGKTTILSLAAGLLRPSAGEIRFQGSSFGYMLQRDELFEWRTIEKNILLPLEIQHCNTLFRRDCALRLAEKYGLNGFLHSFPDELSGGMRQRAALIRTLAPDPDLLLLDEPFSALDYQTRLNVCNDVAHIIRSEKKTAILVTHDISEAISLADKIIVLTKRPARVLAEHTMQFTESEPLKRRENPAFSGIFELLWKELNA